MRFEGFYLPMDFVIAHMNAGYLVNQTLYFLNTQPSYSCMVVFGTTMDALARKSQTPAEIGGKKNSKITGKEILETQKNFLSEAGGLLPYGSALFEDQELIGRSLLKMFVYKLFDF